MVLWIKPVTSELILQFAASTLGVTDLDETKLGPRGHERINKHFLKVVNLDTEKI